jgi:hypothetical protein
MRPSIRLRHVLGTAPRTSGAAASLIGSAASRLARADRPWRPTPSSLFDRCPQHPYYRFYTGGPRIVVDTMLAVPTPLGADGHVREGLDLVDALVDLGASSRSPHRPCDWLWNWAPGVENFSVVLVGSQFCPTLEGPTRAPELINMCRSRRPYLFTA